MWASLLTTNMVHTDVGFLIITLYNTIKALTIYYTFLFSGHLKLF